MKYGGIDYLSDDFCLEKTKADKFDYAGFLKKVSDDTKKMPWVSGKKIMFLMDDSREEKSQQGYFISNTVSTVKQDKRFFVKPEKKYTPPEILREPGEWALKKRSYANSFLENKQYPLILIDGNPDYFILTERAIEQLPGGSLGMAGSETRLKNIAECLATQRSYFTLLYRQDGDIRKIFFIFKNTDAPIFRQDLILDIVERQENAASLQFELLRFTHNITEVGFSFVSEKNDVKSGILFRTSDTGVCSFSCHRAYFYQGKEVHEKEGIGFKRKWHQETENGVVVKKTYFDTEAFDHFIREWAMFGEPEAPDIETLSVSMGTAEKAIIEAGFREIPKSERNGYYITVPYIFDEKVAKRRNFYRKEAMQDTAFKNLCPSGV